MSEEKIDAIVELKKYKEALSEFDKNMLSAHCESKITSHINYLTLKYGPYPQNKNFRGELFTFGQNDPKQNRRIFPNDQTITESFELALNMNIIKLLQDTRRVLEMKIRTEEAKARAEFDALVGAG